MEATPLVVISIGGDEKSAVCLANEELLDSGRCLRLQTRACREEQISMAFSMAGGGPSGPQINVTPLIDVLLTLIIMFMSVVAMEPEYGEKVQIPQPPKDQASEPTPDRKSTRL